MHMYNNGSKCIIEYFYDICMCQCMYAYIHAFVWFRFCIHVQNYSCMHTYNLFMAFIHAYIHVENQVMTFQVAICMHATHIFSNSGHDTHIHKHTYTYTHIHIHIHMHTHTCIHTQTAPDLVTVLLSGRNHTYIHTYTHTHTHTYIHTHTHIHSHTHMHTYADCT
jgi:hypothetical protein